MFNIPFNFREGYSSGDPIPVSSNAKFNIAACFDETIYKQGAPIDVAEVLVYDGAVPDSGLITVWNYFKSKYGFIG
jgi:hypothetical protein